LPKLLHDLQLPPWDAPILLGLNVSWPDQSNQIDDVRKYSHYVLI
jgi:hypothetical protein